MRKFTRWVATRPAVQVENATLVLGAIATAFVGYARLREWGLL